MTNNKPEVLYKYTTFEVGMKILETQTIRFSNPKTFNDPYDCNMPVIFKNLQKLNKDFFIQLNNQVREYIDLKTDIIAKLDYELENLSNFDNTATINANDYLNSILKPFKEDMRILSTSKVNNNLLMWGHYANNHTGIVIGFNTDYKFFKNPQKIKYSENNEFQRLKNALINDILLKRKTSVEELKTYFHTKSADWNYEKEYRFEFSVNNLHKEFISFPDYIKLYPKFFEEIKNKNDYIHPYIIPQCVDSIYIGLNANIVDESKIINLAKNKYPDTKIYKADLSKKEFRIEFNPIN